MARLFSLTVCALLSTAGALTQQRDKPTVLGYRSPATAKKTTSQTPPWRIDSSGNVVPSAALKNFLKNSSANSSAKGRNVLSKNASSAANVTNVTSLLNASASQEDLNSQYQKALGNMKEQWNQQIANAPVDYLQAQKQALGAAMNATDNLMLKVKAWTNAGVGLQNTESEAEKYKRLDANGTRSGTGYHYDASVGSTEKQHWVPNKAVDGTAAWNTVMEKMKVPTFSVPNPQALFGDPAGPPAQPGQVQAWQNMIPSSRQNILPSSRVA